MKQSSRAGRLALAVFNALTRLLPRNFRSVYADDVRQSFADEAREEFRRGGTPALLAATVRAFADVLLTSLQLRRPCAARLSKRQSARESLMKSFSLDVRYAFRISARQPGFTAVAVGTLAIGIGATTAIFTFANAALIRPLPYPDSERLVRVWGQNLVTREYGINVNPLDALDWKREATALETLGIFTTTTQPLTGAGDPIAIPVGLVTSGFFETLGAAAAQGRLFGPEHDRPGRESDVVISDGFWRNVLGGESPVIGRTIMLSDVPCTIAGVLPPDFASPGIAAAVEPQVWRPLIVRPENGRGGHFARSIAKLKTGATIADGQAQVNATSERLEREFPSTNTGSRAVLEPLHEAISGDVRPGILMLLAAVVVVLLIGCANVANLLLSRAASRQREMAVRGALGASPARLVRQLLTESLFIALPAGLIGIGLGALALRTVPGWIAGQLPSVIGARLDTHVLLFSVAVSGATALVFGVAPALHAARADVRSALAGGGDRGGTTASPIHRMLLVAESALALVLLTAALLLIQSLLKLERVNPGFDSSQVLSFRVTLPRARYGSPERRTATLQRVAQEIRRIPGVVTAGGVNISPLTPRNSCDSFGLADRPAPPEGQEPCAESRVATAEYFQAFGIPLVRGRSFAAEDTSAGAPVVLVNETMARKYWPDGEAIGQRFKWGSAAAEGPWRTVVGIVGDVKHFGLDIDAAPEVYVPLGQADTSTMTFAVRTSRDPAALTTDARSAVRSVDGHLPLSEVFTSRQLVERSTAVQRFRTRLLSAFAVVALALAMIGVYGVMAYFVAQRTHELGVRLALGASPQQVRKLIVRRGMGAISLGTAVGIAAAAPLMRLLGGLLFEVRPLDPVTFAVAPSLLLLTALVASYVPARRASRIDPLAAIRVE